MTLVKTDLGFLRIVQKFKIVGRETNNNKGSSSKSLSIFTTILASRIGSWQHYLKITSIALPVSMTLVKTDLGFLRIIQKFKIVGRRPTITRAQVSAAAIAIGSSAVEAGNSGGGYFLMGAGAAGLGYTGYMVGLGLGASPVTLTNPFGWAYWGVTGALAL